VKPYISGLKDVIKLAAYFIATVVIGAVLAPVLFWSAQSLATQGVFPFLARYDFETFFHRALLVAAVLLLWPLLRVSHVRSMADLSLAPNSRWGRDLCAGVVVSVVPLLCCGLLLVALHIYAFRHSFAWASFGKMLAASITVPFIEETFFRGIVLGLFLRMRRKYIAIFAVSAIFAAVHFLKAPERASQIVTWTSGFSSIAHALDGIGDPMMVASALATLFFIGWILADARVLTHSLWLSIGLHAGWIFGSGAFSRLARQQMLAFPWIGKNMLVGIIPLGVAALTWIIMRLWVRYDRASQV
jgi:membrane protease YdiL (CAAX protease family)